MKTVGRCLLVAATCLGAPACGSDTTGPDARFPDAADHGINPRILEQVYDQARETPGIRSLLVQRHGVLVAEDYFHGSSADSLDQVWSVTKSVVSILTGIALDEGYLTSLDQTLDEATGTSTLDFARQHLFGPLGIDRVEWWTDERGYYTGGMGLYLRPCDMVKIGELFLRKGLRGGDRMLPDEWVDASVASHVRTNNAPRFGSHYGYLWWVGAGQGYEFYFANGYAGQFIFVVPELDLVVVATSSWRGLGWNEAGTQWTGVIGVIVDGVLPAVRS